MGMAAQMARRRRWALQSDLETGGVAWAAAATRWRDDEVTYREQ